MKHLLFILILLSFACKKKESAPVPETKNPPATVTPTTTPTPTVPTDTIPRVAKTYTIYLDTYCDYSSSVEIRLGNQSLEGGFDTTFSINKKALINAVRATKYRYMHYSYYSYQNIQTPTGYLPCDADFKITVEGTERVSYIKKPNAYGTIDLYK